jgi:hypothetical protein
MALISTGLRIAREGTITLPVGLAKTMYNIYHTTNSKVKGDEFGLYMKGEWDEQEATVHVADDLFYMPYQTVSPGFIRFDEEPPDPSWNVVIHRHPPGVERFSSVDKESINQEFLASMLYVPEWHFPDAIINVPVSESLKIQIPAKVRVIGGFFDGCEELAAMAAAKIRHGSGAPAAGGVQQPVHVPRAQVKIGQTSEFADGGSCEVVGEAEPVDYSRREPPGETLRREAIRNGAGLRPLGQSFRGGRRQPAGGGGRLTDKELEEIMGSGGVAAGEMLF